MQPRQIIYSLALSASLVLAACATATSAPPTQAPATAVAATSAPTAAPAAAGLLDDIQKRGYMLISNDPNYAPQSVLKKDGSRTAGTKCPGDAFTTGEMEGFDVDVAAGVSKAIGVEACFVTPDWAVITAGNWGD
jgi:polar amino acid transport system substrate-binding protein